MRQALHSRRCLNVEFPDVSACCVLDILAVRDEFTFHCAILWMRYDVIPLKAANGLLSPVVQGGLDITVRTGGVRSVLQDALGQPLLELELGPMDAAAQRLAPGVLKARSAALQPHLSIVCASAFVIAVELDLFL